MLLKLKLSVLSAAAAAALALPLAALAVVPAVESVGKAARIKCGTSTAGTAIYAVHADKIVFFLLTQIQAADPADQPALDAIRRNTELDIKVLDDPRKVGDLKGKVVTFLGAVDTPASRDAVRITDVEYAMVCPTSL